MGYGGTTGLHAAACMLGIIQVNINSWPEFSAALCIVFSQFHSLIQDHMFLVNISHLFPDVLPYDVCFSNLVFQILTLYIYTACSN